MAEAAALGAVINKTMEIAADQLTQLGNRVRNLPEDIRWIQAEMRTLQSYLKDAESKKAASHEAAELIISIRDLAHDVEDILDTYLPQIDSHKRKRSFHFVKSTACVLCHASAANNFALEIEKIKSRVEGIEAARARCGVTASVRGTDADTWDSRRSFLLVKDSKIFGREETLEKLEAKMLSEDSECRVISIVGPGGVGKTTVAKKVYNKVKNEFDCSAMFYVSQKPKVRELILEIANQVGLDTVKKNYKELLRGIANLLKLKVKKAAEAKDLLLEIANKAGLDKSKELLLDLANQVGSDEKKEFKCLLLDMADEVDFAKGNDEYLDEKEKMKEFLLETANQVGTDEKDDLEVRLLSFLKQKRFIVFLDDIWHTETWDRLKYIIPTYSKKGSRIIVTSRYDHVGGHIGGQNSLHRLAPLDTNEGNELFFNLISADSDDLLPQFLKNIGEKIVERCYGFPLAIVVAVGMLRQRERSKQAWNEVLESFSRGAENDCSKVLALSYQDLPIELRPFFLYFGLFPEMREIFVSELIETWIAEKFIRSSGEEKPEEIVEANIRKLTARNLIQVVRRRCDGRVRSCRMHDLMRGLCIQVAKETNFFCSLNSLESTGFDSIARRVTTTTYNFKENASQEFRLPQKVRALLCFSKDEGLYQFLRNNVSDLRFLRLLIIEIEGGGYLRLPKEIGNLISLGYLKLKGDLKSIPSRISSLKNLLTLEVRPHSNSELPVSILRMKQLKHLLLGDVSFRLWRYMYGIEDILPNLQTLDSIKGEYLTSGLLKKLPNLRKLRIIGITDQIAEALSSNTLSMQKLEDLRIRNEVDTQVEIRLDLSHYQCLKKLHLRNLELVSTQLPQSLVSITYEEVLFNMSEDYMKPLKELVNLEILKIKECQFWKYSKLDFSGIDSFPQLQVLVIMRSYFHELIVDETGMPNLYKFMHQPYHISPPDVPERLRQVVVMANQ